MIKIRNKAMQVIKAIQAMQVIKAIQIKMLK
ncbi:hypothetical protein M457_0208825 [Staphylococcus epidermidis Scl19]|nr:hypothetical protein M457_0208825 [Staphylococcus epidermidis Scl19]